MRLIDADALLNNIRRAIYPSDMTTTIAVDICESHVKNMPTVDAVTLDETERAALERFREYRDRGVRNRTIRDPVAWALYNVWRDYDSHAGMEEAEK